MTTEFRRRGDGQGYSSPSHLSLRAATSNRPWMLVGVDGFPDSERALRRAVEISKVSDAVICPVFVEEALPALEIAALTAPGSKPGALEEIYVEHYKKAREQVLCATEELSVDIGPLLVVQGRPADVLIHLALELRCDLIVLGRRARGFLHRLRQGSTAQAVVARAPCPVLVVP